MAKNKVIAGDYTGKTVLSVLGTVSISTGLSKSVILDKINVESYEVLDENKRKSATSIAGRGLLGGLLLGPVGLAAGALSAKSKGTYIVAVQFKDGCKSLLEINQKIYKNLMRQLF